MLDYISRYGGVLLQGVQTTIYVSLGAFVVAVTVGLLIAGMQLSPFRLFRWIANIYVDVCRSVPVLVLLLWGFYVVPILVGFRLSATTTGTLVLGLALSAYYAEIFRSGINTVPSGQREAGLAQGMTTLQVMRRNVLPQAVLRVLPQTTGMTISLVKDSSLVSILGVPDLMYKVNTIAAVTLDPFVLVSMAGLLYLVITMPLALLGNSFHRRFVEKV